MDQVRAVASMNVAAEQVHFFATWLMGGGGPLDLPLPMHMHARPCAHTQQIGVGVFPALHDCFTMELAGECLKCLFRLTLGVPTLMV